MKIPEGTPGVTLHLKRSPSTLFPAAHSNIEALPNILANNILSLGLDTTDNFDVYSIMSSPETSAGFHTG